MVGPSFSLRALVGVATGLLLAAGLPAAPTAAAGPDDEGYDAPLEVTIESLTPGVLPRSGPVVVRGTVTNVDLETWSAINLYPMVSSGPGCSSGCAEVMTTPAELEVAADSDPEAQVGVRYTAISDDIAALEPGQSAQFTLRIPQAVLRTLFPRPTAGVYWFGVHALGASASHPRDVFADGRARTFLPYFPANAGTPVDTAVVLPLRARIASSDDGSLARTSAWQRSLAVDGELGGPLAFGAASGPAPVTWLLDPAVPDAVRRLAQGNPQRRIAAAPPKEDPSASEDPSDETGEEDQDETDDPPADDPLANAAQTWLDRARTAFDTDPVVALPYGDPDVAAAADALPSLYRAAREQTSSVLEEWELEPQPVVAAPDGYLDRSGIDAVDDDAALLLGEAMFPQETFSADAPVAGLIGERPVVVTSPAAAEGGPGPDPAQAPVALRQRILAEAAVRMVQADGARPAPLVVVLPPTVSATGASEFWSGLEVSWLDLAPLEELVEPAGSTTAGADADRQIDPADLAYPATQERAELSGSVLAEAGRLIRAARALQGILGEGYDIGDELIAEALTGSSYAMRGDKDAAGRLARTRSWAEDQLAKVSIDAPNGVTLSGTSGGFNVAVRNDLDQPVTVQVRASTDSGATIRVANPIRIEANSSTSVPVSADMSRTGVHNVTLRLTDTEGLPTGGQDTLPLRTGQAGVVIWAIIGTGAGILFLAIGIRLYRRIRHGSSGQSSGEPSGEPSGAGA